LLAAFSLFDAIVRRKEYLLHLSTTVGMMVADKSCEVWIARFTVAALMAAHLRFSTKTKPSKDIIFLVHGSLAESALLAAITVCWSVDF
jgi:hypothetical protein